ncbi:N-acetylglucosaminyl-diphospho-decaprenol L-rhamnosyltransferase [compost metagenome]
MNSTIKTSDTKKTLLTISIVTYHPDLNELKKTLSALSDALVTLDSPAVAITIIDNSSDDSVASVINACLLEWPTRLIQGQGNVGFGQGHNLALAEVGEFHLVLNPDVQMDQLALRNSIDFMHNNPNCGLLSPLARWPNGERQYLCKRYPAILDLVLRGFAPKRIQTFFGARLAHYEMRSETQNKTYWNPLIISGCFMLFRREVLEKTRGFSPDYFLYFEDFDLSIRSGEVTDIAYVPSVKVVHTGGHASRKGPWHIWQFFKSSLRFYTRHGFHLF